MKAYTFREEKEWRILLMLSTGSSKVHFRSLKGTLVPYVPIDLKLSGRLPITRIRVGPCQHPIEAQDALRRYLKSLDLDRIHVDASPIPIRV